MCSCHQQRLEVVLMIENYLTAIIYILLIVLVITAIIAFALIDYSFEQTTIKIKAHFCSCQCKMCFFYQRQPHICGSLFSYIIKHYF